MIVSVKNEWSLKGRKQSLQAIEPELDTTVALSLSFYPKLLLMDWEVEKSKRLHRKYVQK